MSFSVDDRIRVTRDGMRPEGDSPLVGKEGVVLQVRSSDVLSTQVDLEGEEAVLWFTEHELELLPLVEPEKWDAAVFDNDAGVVKLLASAVDGLTKEGAECRSQLETLIHRNTELSQEVERLEDHIRRANTQRSYDLDQIAQLERDYELLRDEADDALLRAERAEDLLDEHKAALRTLAGD